MEKHPEFDSRMKIPEHSTPSTDTSERSAVKSAADPPTEATQKSAAKSEPGQYAH